MPVSVFSAKDNNIEEVFKRINSTGKHLSQQELRQIGVSSDYAILVRQLSSEIRGDYSTDTLSLNEMSKISLSNYRLNYSINVSDIFWIKNDIINSNDLRQSRDEEIVAFLLAGIILDTKLKLYYTGTILNKFYGYSRNPLDTDKPIEMTSLQNAIDRIGIDNIKNRFHIVMSCIKDVLTFSKSSFRNIIKADKSISDLSIQFQIVFMAIYRLMILEKKTDYNIKELSEKLKLNGNYLNDTDIRNNKKLNTKTPTMETLIQNLSGGNQQKVLFARWLLTTPDILILDEPTRGIDVGAKYEIYTIMQSLAAEGKAIIMISSEMPELLGMSDRVMVMSDGHLAGILDKEQADQVEVMRLATAYL